MPLFDPYDNVLTEKTRKRLLDGWAGVFRQGKTLDELKENMIDAYRMMLHEKTP